MEYFSSTKSRGEFTHIVRTGAKMIAATMITHDVIILFVRNVNLNLLCLHQSLGQLYRVRYRPGSVAHGIGRHFAVAGG